MNIRPRESSDETSVAAFLAEHGAERVARFGRVENPLGHPALVADLDGGVAGVLTYVVGVEDCEILTLHARDRGRGVGTALVEAVEPIARERGCSRLWVLTTNDNLDALRFYQRRGFRLASLYPGAVDMARDRLKPEIPETGSFGIAIRDEIVLRKPIIA